MMGKISSIWPGEASQTTKLNPRPCQFFSMISLFIILLFFLAFCINYIIMFIYFTQKLNNEYPEKLGATLHRYCDDAILIAGKALNLYLKLLLR